MPRDTGVSKANRRVRESPAIRLAYCADAAFCFGVVTWMMRLVLL
jgi:hypothetical protein